MVALINWEVKQIWLAVWREICWFCWWLIDGCWQFNRSFGTPILPECCSRVCCVSSLSLNDLVDIVRPCILLKVFCRWRASSIDCRISQYVRVHCRMSLYTTVEALSTCERFVFHRCKARETRVTARVYCGAPLSVCTIVGYTCTCISICFLVFGRADPLIIWLVYKNELDLRKNLQWKCCNSTVALDEATLVLSPNEKAK